METKKKNWLITACLLCLFMLLAGGAGAQNNPGDFQVDNGVLIRYTGPGGFVEIPNDMGITTIGDMVFYNNPSIMSVSIPEGVTTIGYRAFNRCFSLNNVFFPFSLQYIGDEAFDFCYSLIGMIIPDNVVSIGASAFSFCFGLRNIAIPYSVKTIGNNAFWNCMYIETVSISSSVENIGLGAFGACFELREINVDPYNQYYSSEGGVLYDKHKTILYCHPPRKYYDPFMPLFSVPNSVKTIEHDAFSNSWFLKSVYIPNSVDFIGSNSFMQCHFLTEIVVEEGNRNYLSEEGVLYDKNKQWLIVYPNQKSSISFSVPNSVEIISNIEYCYNLESVYIPASVMSIDGLNGSKFGHCYSLKNIDVSAYNSFFSSDHGVLYNKEQTVLYCHPSQKESDFFIIPNSVESIDVYAFGHCSLLTSIIIPNSVKEFNYGSFYRCNNLTSLMIPNSVDKISTGAFDFCDNLKDIYVHRIIPLPMDSWISLNSFNRSACTLHVPVGTKGAYKNAHYWKDFGFIIDDIEFNPVTGVLLDRTNIEMYPKNTEQLIATVSPEAASYKNLIWSSNTPRVAIVSDAGLVTARSKGTATITVTTEDGGFTASCIVTVLSPNFIWEGTISDDWNDDENWLGGEKPTATSVVEIPTPSESMNYFPVLNSPVTISEIYFEPGAQLGGQHHLTGKAFIQYDLRKRDSWQMFSMPLGEAFPGDFTFGGYPLTWVRTFKAVTKDNVTTGGWETAQQSTKPFSFGDGFVLWLDSDKSATQKGLKLLEGIHEIPFFHHHEGDLDDRQWYGKIHQTHEYYSYYTRSTFYNITSIGENEYQRNWNESYVIFRDLAKAYRLAGDNFSKPYTFAGGFALIGNPYMAALDFVALTEENKNVIKPFYYVWTDAGSGNGSGGYQTFSPEEGLPAGLISGDNSDGRLIAPLQGFIVAKPEGATSDAFTLLFKEESMTAVNKDAVLRSSANNTDRLDIVARNPVAGVRTFIAKRENGQTTFGNSDARKMINSISDIPEVYTLKTYKNDMIGVAINIINSDDLLIPIGLATSYAGNITLTFSGMDNYNANLSLFDAESGRTIDLTGLASYEYTFNYTPKTVKNESTACENRFFIRISKSTTGLQETLAGKVNVFESNGLIQVISNASSPIKEVEVYDLQGALIYKEIAINAISHTIGKYLPSGMYVVKVISEKGVDNVKVVKR